MAWQVGRPGADDAERLSRPRQYGETKALGEKAGLYKPIRCRWWFLRDEVITVSKMSTESRPRQTAKAAPPKAPPMKAPSPKVKASPVKTPRAVAPVAKPAPTKAVQAKAAAPTKAAPPKGAQAKSKPVPAKSAAPKATLPKDAPKVAKNAPATATPTSPPTKTSATQANIPAARPAAPQVSPAKAAIAAKVSPAKAETKSVTASVPKAAKTVSVKAAMSVKSSASKSSVSEDGVEAQAAEKSAKVKPAAVQAVTTAPAAVDTAPKTAAKVVPLKTADKEVFQPDDYVVYPTHGVGRILKIEKQEISGIALELFVIEFDKDKMTLRVPLAKVRQVGMRRLSTPQKMKAALDTLKGRARVKRTMWSRRAQEYEAKINSGDPVSIAEVVRDLHRNAGQPDQSYSERQIYEAALDRLARELAAVERIDEDAATKRLEKLMKAA